MTLTMIQDPIIEQIGWTRHDNSTAFQSDIGNSLDPKDYFYSADSCKAFGGGQPSLLGLLDKHDTAEMTKVQMKLVI
jgi:hypothetical protein